ncbi:MAG: glycosyltransferase family 2 protein [Bacteroidales bacterium]
MIEFLINILFVYMAVSIAYLFIFALFSFSGVRKRYPNSYKEHHFLILIPSYKDDSVIIESVNCALSQDYSFDKFDIVVISDNMDSSTNNSLRELPITLFEINPKRSSKAVALNYAIDNLEKKDYDIVTILDSDNIICNNYLQEINNAYQSGSLAIQAHRTAKNTNNSIAVLDAISEEINNSIFRRGHVNMGLSAALIGSGMAFDYLWFVNNVKSLTTVGEDKELELLLLKEGIFIDFLDHVLVYDQKTKKESVFFNQRRRWLGAQFSSLYSGIKDLPKSFINLRIDYIDKMFQWMLLPRILILGICILMAFIITIISWEASLRWWILVALLLFAFALAVPDSLVTKTNIRALKKLPIIFMLMFLNLFRLRNAGNKFIHTKKE